MKSGGLSSLVVGMRPRRGVRRRFPALLSGVLVCGLVLWSVTTWPFSAKWYNVQELDAAIRHPPAFAPIVPVAMYERSSGSSREGGGRGFFVRAAHGMTSWFGHDDLGRSLFYRVMLGFPLSLAMGVAAAVMAAGIGVTWGAAAGLAGGRVDSALMRVVDVLYGLPYILLVILLKVGLTKPLVLLLGGHARMADVFVLLAAIGGVSWLTMARVIRGQVLTLRAQPFIEASRAAGAGAGRIFLRHLLPNLIGPIIAYATLIVPQAVLQESFLSFLGIGIQPPLPSLGRLAADGVYAINPFVGYWWLIVFPCGVLVVTLLALNFIGDALRDRFDPKAPVAAIV